MTAWKRLVLKVVMLMCHVTSLVISLLLPEKKKKKPFSAWPLEKIPEGAHSDVENMSTSSFQMLSEDLDSLSARYSMVTPTPGSPTHSVTSQASAMSTQLNPEDIQLMGEPPLCQHGYPGRIFITRKQGPNFGRTFWRCREARGNQCSFFAWTEFQPNWSQSEPEPLTPAGIWKSPTPSPSSPAGTASSSTGRTKTCAHLRIDKSGSNGFKIREKCADCGKLLKAVDREQPTIPKSKAKAKQAVQQITVEEMEEFNEFQEFRRWQKSRGPKDGEPDHKV